MAWYLPTVSQRDVKTLSLGNMNEIFSISRSILYSLETEKWNCTYLFIVKEQYMLQWQILSWDKGKQGPWKYIQKSNQIGNFRAPIAASEKFDLFLQQLLYFRKKNKSPIL